MSLEPGKTRIGFIGLGIMGSSMARHVRSAGFELGVFARRPEAAQPLLQLGARAFESPRALAAASDVVVTIVGFPSDVESLYLGDGGLIEAARPGSYLVDMTTSSPSLARRIASTARSRGVFALDAPVTGGDAGAREARLSIMVGGETAAFEALRPLLRVLGTTLVRQGEAGAGQHAKLANQIAVACTMLGVSEALGYAKRAGLEPESVLKSISQGAAKSFALEHLAPKMLAGDFAPGFFVKHLVKDLGLALAEANDLGFDAPGLRLVLERYRTLMDLGYSEAGTQVLFQLYR